jgi:hypothetical protein
MNDRYNRAAYKKTVWREAARLLREALFPEVGPRQPLLCDEVFRAPREVPSEIVQEVLVALHKAERNEDESMTRYRLEEMRDDKVEQLTESPKVGRGKRGAAKGTPAAKLQEDDRGR